MSFFRALVGAVRAARHAPRLAEGLTPDDDVLLDAPDGRLAPALVAAALGDPEPSAKLLATTRDAGEWEDRDRYVRRLATFAYSRGEWLDRWLEAAPRDPDALLVSAQLAVGRAWESPARAERLRELDPLLRPLAEESGRDPVPWRLALDHARGAHAGHAVFEGLWERALLRSPHHYGCHVAALSYLSARWYGSDRAAFDFAEQAADDAAPGSLVRALPVRAAYEALRPPGAGRGPVAPGPPPSGPPAAGHRPDTARIDAAADRGLALSAAFGAGDPWPAEVRNLLAHVLVERERWEEALAEFGRAGPYATSFPWAVGGHDPLRRFLATRDRARTEVARRTPLRERVGTISGRSGPRGH
ncbi:hypothetical protein [Streptomyces griseus]|uniref:hypothetical protein n=1 Tax=Streptomyces griseus TaxID=1911 RepID=UPI0004C47ECE|nr:hypothetical protein [Streptomyces griseus]